MYAQVSVPKQEEKKKEVTAFSLHAGIMNMFCASHKPGNAEKQKL